MLEESIRPERVETQNNDKVHSAALSDPQFGKRTEQTNQTTADGSLQLRTTTSQFLKLIEEFKSITELAFDAAVKKLSLLGKLKIVRISNSLLYAAG